MTVNKNMIIESCIELTGGNDLRGVSSGPWKQDGMIVTNGELNLKVGTCIQEYYANCWYRVWKVIGVDENGNLLITSDLYEETVTFYSRSSYIHGVERFNEVAKKYFNPQYALYSRSIDVRDINKVTGYNPETAGYGKGKIYEYGNKVEYFWAEENVVNHGHPIYAVNDGYPIYIGNNGVKGSLNVSHRVRSLWGMNMGTEFYYPSTRDWKISESSVTDLSRECVKITSLRSTYYGYYGRDPSDLDDDVFDFLFGKNFISYWLGTPYVYCGTRYVEYGFHVVGGGGVNGIEFFDSTGECKWPSPSCKFRPVVALKPEVKLKKEGWNISII